jgi:sugar lactone lactonase YvrE
MRVLRALIASVLVASPAMAHPGWGIVVDREGTVFYTDLKQVLRIGTDGKVAVAVPDVHSHALHLDAEGVLRGEHLWYDNAKSKWGHYEWELRNGTVVRHPAKEGLPDPPGPARDAKGNLYWVDGPKVFRAERGGAAAQLATIPRDGETPGQAPGGILAVGLDGNVYVVSDGDLYRVGPAGSVARLARDLDEHVVTSFMMQPWHYVMGLAGDPSGNVWVANTGARKLKKVSPDGKVTVVLDADFPWAPTGIALRGRDVYVLEYTDTGGSVRVRRVGPDGRAVRLPSK